MGLKTDYEQVWGVPLEDNTHAKCPTCETKDIERHFCGEYTCKNGHNFGVCNLWNTTTDPYVVLKKKIKSTD